MKERRKFTRSMLPQKAKFFGAKGWEDCIITEVSRKGLGVKFYTSEKINEGSIIHLKVLVPTESKPVMVKGLLRWIKKMEGYFVGGIEWYHIDKGPKSPK